MNTIQKLSRTLGNELFNKHNYLESADEQEKYTKICNYIDQNLKLYGHEDDELKNLIIEYGTACKRNRFIEGFYRAVQIFSE